MANGHDLQHSILSSQGLQSLNFVSLKQNMEQNIKGPAMSHAYDKCCQNSLAPLLCNLMFIFGFFETMFLYTSLAVLELWRSDWP